MKEDFSEYGIRNFEDVRNINKQLIEKTFYMRCLAYLSGEKARLLTNTILRIDLHRKNLKKQFEEQKLVAEATRKYSLIFDNIRDAILITDKAGFVTDCNAATRNIFGLSKENILGKHFESLHISSYSDTQPHNVTVYDTHDEFWSGEITFTRKDGNTGVCETVIVPLSDENGCHSSLIVFYHEITERKKLEQELEELATIDKLTQVYNRVKSDELIKREVERAKRYNNAMSVLMFDIDHFKTVNDAHGHFVGDYVLKTTASLAKNTIRDIDYIVRWGGEEFLIIAPETPIDQAERLAERIRKTMESHKFDTVNTITASFGVTAYKNNDTENSLINRADTAMYKAKTNGRNRVETLL